MRIVITVSEKDGKEIKSFCRRNGLIQSALGRNLLINAVRKGVVPIMDGDSDDVPVKRKSKESEDMF